MPELEVLEARVPVRTPVLARETETVTSRLVPVGNWFSGPVFSRARDIFAANMTELLDRSEDPSRMIRMKYGARGTASLRRPIARTLDHSENAAAS